MSNYILRDHIIFADERHSDFYFDTMNKIRNKQLYGEDDIYYRSFWYLIGLCDVTRRNNARIFNFDSRGISIGALEEGWQTSESMRITRLAFNFFNGCTYENQEDFEAGKVSPWYAVDEIFSSSKKDFFYQAIKLRFPG